MRVMHGTETIGHVNDVEVKVNWDYLQRDLGMKREVEITEKIIGQIFRLLGVAGIVAGLVVALNNGTLNLENWVSWNLVEVVMFWVGTMFFIYSFYLLRNRDIYLDNIHSDTIINLKKRLEKKGVKTIDIQNYIDHDFLWILDDLLEYDSDGFLIFLVKELLKLDLVNISLDRLGLSHLEVLEDMKSYKFETDTSIDEWIKKLLFGSLEIALANNFNKIDEVAAFIYISKDAFKTYLRSKDVQENEIKAIELWHSNQNLLQRYKNLFAARKTLKPVKSVNRSYTSRFAASLEKFARDFTVEVIRLGFVYSIGRESEMDRLIQFLHEGDANATLIIGAPGVGKTTFLKSLAVRLVCEDVPASLFDKRLVNFESVKAFAISKQFEDFKLIIQKVFEETAKAGNIILVLEDLEQLVNVRRDFSAEIVSLIIQAVENYKLKIIATTNPEGFASHISKIAPLTSLFNIVHLEEPSDEVTMQILMDELPNIEKKYKLKINFDALSKAVNLSHKFYYDRINPDKSLELLNEACSKAQLDRLNFIGEKQIEERVSEKIGINIGKITSKESEKLLNLEASIHKRIVDQDEAVQAVSSALRRGRAGLTSGKRPIASFFFFGPTGVGKTELAKALAEVYFGSEKLMIRLDMSEYQEQQNLGRLIGSAEEYSDGGYLTEAVRKRPFSLILLDEIEKANPKVLDLFLQVLDEGFITDGLGKKIFFSDTIIIMTSNVLSNEIASQIVQGTRYVQVYRNVTPLLREHLRIEFLNRFDKIIMFKPLMPIEVLQVADLLMQEEKRKLKEKGIELLYTEDVLKELVDIGYDEVYGARGIRRAVQDSVQDLLARLIISNELASGKVVKLTGLNKYEID